MTIALPDGPPTSRLAASEALRYPTRVLSGTQPTLHLHLGHYFGAIRHQIALHHEYPFRTFYLIADYHALVRRIPPEDVRNGVVAVATAYLALGLDPVKAVLFRQSDVPAICELAWIISTLTPFQSVSRIATFRRKEPHQQTAALLSYPILQAADILAMRATIVPAGLDQKIHIELAGTLADRFNRQFNAAVFPHARVRLSTTPTVKGLDGKRMHAGVGNQIELFARYSYFKERVAAIVTRNEVLGERLDPSNCTVYHLLSLVLDEAALAEVKDAYLNGAMGYRDAKARLLHALMDTFAPFEERYHDLKANPDLVLDVLSEGFRTATREAAAVLEIARELTGLRGRAQLTGNR